MYIQKMKRNSKTPGSDKVYTSTILAESYRDGGKMKRRVIANLSKVPDHIVTQIQKALKGGKVTSLNDLEYEQGKKFGAIFTLNKVANSLGISDALGKSENSKLALVQILARILHQRSRLSIAKEWQHEQALKEVLAVDSFNEDHLYANLDWLCDNQEKIEDRLFFKKYSKGDIGDVYLYDVTSSYFEGQENELAEYGYNRDGKKGKKQIVIGLLCDHDGDPISVEVFKGNSGDTSTVSSQLQKLKDRFGVKRMVFVGDKGMIKSTQIDELTDLKYSYITTITKPQIRSLVDNGILQLDLFDQDINEIDHDDVRYVMRRNPLRAQEISKNRAQRISSIKEIVVDRNLYLTQHKRAKTSTAVNYVKKKISEYKLQSILTVGADAGGVVVLSIDDNALAEAAKFDGCYCMKTDLKDLDKQVIHDRYKDLASVESAFRTMKTSLEEIRPIFVRKEKRTRGHVFACMLAYKIVRHVWHKNKNNNLDLSLKGILDTLDNIQYVSFDLAGHKIKRLPTSLSMQQKEVLNNLGVQMPKIL